MAARTVELLQQGRGVGFLGHGPKTIKQSGCLLTCLTMAVNAYQDEHLSRWSLEGMNYKLEKLKLFDDQCRFVVASAFKQFGIVIDRGPFIPMIVDQALQKKDLVVVGVDYKAGASSARSHADHFVLFFSTDMKGNYLAADPMTGSIIRFDKVTVSAKVKSMTWKAVEMMVLKKLNGGILK